MESRAINTPDAPPASGGYSQAVETTGASRLLFVSGQIPVDADRSMAAGLPRPLPPPREPEVARPRNDDRAHR